jgi:hypothetical protein
MALTSVADSETGDQLSSAFARRIVVLVLNGCRPAAEECLISIVHYLRTNERMSRGRDSLNRRSVPNRLPFGKVTVTFSLEFDAPRDH